jgi:Tol biopolymer transport system component
VDGTYPTLITNSLYAFGDTDAIWLPNGQIAAILTKSGDSEITILSADGAIINTRPTSPAAPVNIYPTSDGSYVYWESGSCISVGICQVSESWVTSLNGKLNKELTGVSGPVLSPDEAYLVSAASTPKNQNSLVFALPDGTNPRSYQLPGTLLLDYAWSPTGDILAAVVAMVSDYSGKSSGNRNFMVDAHSLSVSEYAQSSLMNPKVLWSPDGSYLFWMGTLPNETGFKIGGNLVNRNSKQITDMTNAIGHSSANYLAVTNADWLLLP